MGQFEVEVYVGGRKVDVKEVRVEGQKISIKGEFDAKKKAAPSPTEDIEALYQAVDEANDRARVATAEYLALANS